ncbi:hypothetical protein SAMN05443637_116152 [Pseudonocardia thermophila]|uniref:Uncharacterized protein n=1 Tax=Pseudonocardia thermophila TaxID=1848 RepID=A0A1M6XC00_PSETH|nr:hypothetical protein [Pseudonocardia thermophila]SHL03325.1 hypothetical protein SAMN05443637_116152 [Pseudonocardia thermophila]
MSPTTYTTRPTTDPIADPIADAPTEIIRPYPNRPEINNTTHDIPQRPTLDPVKLWTGGIATAVVAALIGLVGTLIVQAGLTIGLPTTGAFGEHTTALLCTLAAIAALAATGLAHLLMISTTPRPLAYLGWIIGLVTAATTVTPFLTTTALPLAAATAVIHLVIGMAIASLITGAAAASRR